MGLLMGAGTTVEADSWPASVAGTWEAVANQTQGTLQITQGEAVAGSTCRAINGTLFGTESIEGFYCPGSGRIAFKCTPSGTTSSSQTYIGNVSQIGPVLHIGGTFVAVTNNGTVGTSGGDLGEYSFSASK
jgi:hypothetical protein